MDSMTGFIAPLRCRGRRGALALSVAVILCCASSLDAADEEPRYSAEVALSQLIPYLSTRGFDADSQFKVRRHWSDQLGQTHTHLQQSYREVPIWTAEVIVHLDANGKVLPISAKALMPSIQ